MPLLNYYKQNPPLHIMVKAYLGMGEKPKEEQQMSFDDFFKEVNGG